MLPLAFVVDPPWTLAMPGLGVWAALLGLAALSTAFAYLMYYRILATAGAVNLMLVTFLVPVARSSSARCSSTSGWSRSISSAWRDRPGACSNRRKTDPAPPPGARLRPASGVVVGDHRVGDLARVDHADDVGGARNTRLPADHDGDATAAPAHPADHGV